MRDYIKPRKPTADELYLEALRIRIDYVKAGVQLDFNFNSNTSKETERALEHYRKKAGVEE